MAQCKAVTKRGTPCTLPALPGSDYCRFHQKYQADSAPPEAAPSTAEEGKVAVQYLGRGTYWVAGFEFSPATPIHKVSRPLAEHLLKMPALFKLTE